MGRKRGEIIEVVRRFIASGRDICIVIVERGTASGTRRIRSSEVARVKPKYIELRDSTIIPLHRVLAVEDSSGKVLWRRS